MSRDLVGELRPSQLLHTYGVGATVELPELTTLVLGLDDWPEELGKKVSEPRLLAAVRAAGFPEVRELLTPPVVPEGESLGVPVSPFPRWLRCPLCSRLAPIESGLFKFKPDLWRPERTTYVHEGCPKSTGRRPPTAYPARYLVACPNGHLDDFPWVEFLHGGVPCRSLLKLTELGSGGRAADVQVSCDECRRSRRLSQAFGEDAAPYLPPACRGRHPHLGPARDSCDQPLVTLVLGASNSWFPVQSSALSIPSKAGELAQLVDESWADLEEVDDAKMLDFALRRIDTLRDLRRLAKKIGAEAILQAIEERRKGLSDGDPEDLRTPEWRVLCDPQTPETPDFKLKAVGPPRGFEAQVSEVVLVERLREVSALRGFTRLNAPDDLGARGGKVAPLSRHEPEWLPCSEVRGEGLFIRFDEDAVMEWEQRYRDAGLAERLRAGQRAWRVRRHLEPEGAWPGERYVLLHSFAHAVIRELALECGYTASSIRERLYASDDGDEPMAGVLLYTAAPDSEGTLGGLVSLGVPEQLGPLLRHALERAQLCSSDPLCSEHDPQTDSSMHLAACHACQFASETSCEQGNRLLDRTTLVPTLAGHDTAFFGLA